MTHFDDDVQQRSVERTLMKQYRSLVINIASRYRYFREFDDLVQEGNIGLLMAIRKADYARFDCFPAYAKLWIKAYMLTYIQGGSGKRPRLTRRFKEIQELERAALAAGKSLTDKELADALQVSLLAVEEWRNYRNLCSASELTGVVEKCHNENPEELLILREEEHTRSRKLTQALASLGARNSQVMVRHYQEDHSFQAISKEFDISGERVRQLHNRALETMREVIK